MTSSTIQLELGSLDIQIRHQTWPLDRLCGFACRRNPRRPFLIVSKILGKHVPADPKLLVSACDDLIDMLPDLAAPVCVIGMAETATSLAETVFERLMGRSRPLPHVCSHTTRYSLSQPLALTLEESHSHATRHLVYRPQSSLAARLFDQAASLVIVDDEFTTGNTAVNLALAYAEKNPNLKQIALVCLTNWITDADQQEVRRRIESASGAQVSFHSLLSGDLRFIGNGNRVEPPSVSAAGSGTLRDDYLRHNTGRLGITKPPRFDFAAMLASYRLARRVAVVGTGEYMYPPSLVARWLADQGHEVTIQSSTRSPIALGGAIESSIDCVDNYHDGINNYLYNHRAAIASEQRSTLVCYETEPLPEHHDLADQLGASIVFPNRYLVDEPSEPEDSV